MNTNIYGDFQICNSVPLNLFAEIFLRTQIKNSHKHYQAIQGHLKLDCIRKFIWKQSLADFLKNFPIFAGKHLCWCLFLIYWKEIPTQVCFPVNIANFLGTSFLKNMRWLLLFIDYKIRGQYFLSKPSQNIRKLGFPDVFRGRWRGALTRNWLKTVLLICYKSSGN